MHVTARLSRVTAAKGSLNFTLSLDGIRREVAGIRLFLLLYAVIDSAIIILFGLYFFSRLITRPLKGLEETTARIASGAFDKRVGVEAENEIGRLADSFNTMAERVEAEIKALERVNSELVSTQEDLLRTQTLAALGRMAAGIAHEVGNPLGAVQGYLEILGDGKGVSEESVEIVSRTIEEVRRIDKILREFLSVSRPSASDIPPEADVNLVVKETLSMFNAHKEAGSITIKTALSDNLPMVLIDTDKLRQVILNLLLNAAQSMEGVAGQRLITVETTLEVTEDVAYAAATQGKFRRRKGDVKSGVSLMSAEMSTHSVAIRITDRGHGVATKDAEKIFEPFFSTKEIGKGTGLGLFVSDMIIKAYRGSMLFDSALGVGSTFTVLVPTGKTVGKDKV